MPATQKKCEWCKKKFWATRKDAMYCSEKCRRSTRSETSRFEISVLPHSGVPGVTYHRIRRAWIANFCKNYLGASKNLDEAIAMRRKAEEGWVKANPAHHRARDKKGKFIK